MKTEESKRSAKFSSKLNWEIKHKKKRKVKQIDRKYIQTVEINTLLKIIEEIRDKPIIRKTIFNPEIAKQGIEEFLRQNQKEAKAQK